MKASKDFILRSIAGESILVPVGAAAAKFNGLITMNGIGNFIFQALGEDQTEDSLVERIVAEYDVSRETALADLKEFLQQMREIGALEE